MTATRKGSKEGSIFALPIINQTKELKHIEFQLAKILYPKVTNSQYLARFAIPLRFLICKICTVIRKKSFHPYIRPLNEAVS